MRDFVGRLRERVRRRLMRDKPMFFTAEALDRAIDREMRRLADEVFERSQFANSKREDE